MAAGLRSRELDATRNKHTDFTSIDELRPKPQQRVALLVRHVKLGRDSLSPARPGPRMQ